MAKDLFALFYCLQFLFSSLSVVDSVNVANSKGTDSHSNNTQQPNTDKHKPDDAEILDKVSYYENENATFGKQGVSDAYYLWPNATVHYEIAKDFSPFARRLIRVAMDGIQNRTCVRFVEVQGKGEQDRVVFRSGPDPSCYAETLGYTHKPRQYVKLGDNCVPSNLKLGGIQHEILHVLGFAHVHQRPDRDKYIDMFWDNIKPDLSSRSQMVIWKYHPAIQTYESVPYDYSSVMHYPNNGMAVDISEPTMSKKGDDSVCLGQANGVTECDLELIRHAYGCHVMNSCKPELNYKEFSWPAFWTRTCLHLW